MNLTLATRSFGYDLEYFHDGEALSPEWGESGSRIN